MVTPAKPILPREEILVAWRAAVQAYRFEHRATCDDLLARTAAFEAFRKVLPDLPEQQAKEETAHAIAYAATHHTEWFWGRRACVERAAKFQLSNRHGQEADDPRREHPRWRDVEIAMRHAGL
jgi:hypothetical protein